MTGDESSSSDARMKFLGNFLMLIAFGAAGCVVVACDTTNSLPASVPGPTAPGVNNAPVKLITPAPTLLPLPLPTLPMAPVVTPPPTPRPTPSPQPTPAPGPWVLPWSSAERDYAINTLQTDHHDDTQAEQTYPNEAAYYAMWASRWQTGLDQIAWMDSTSTPPSAASIAQEEAWYQQAYALHQLDEQKYPQNTWWDSLWCGHYAHLLSLWKQL